MLGLAAWGLSRTRSEEIAVHWDASGAPNVWADRHVAFLILPMIGALVALLLGAAPGLMPARSRIERSAGAYTATWMVVLLGMVVSQFMIVALNAGLAIYAPRLVGVLVAIFLLVTGNWMGKIRYNFLFGVRTPWTLADEWVWDKTHRFTGRLMVLGGVLLLIASFALPGARTALAPGPALITAFIVCSLGPALAGVVYSAVISRSGGQGGQSQ
jgi:uncharacterized membrane protein